MSLVLRDGSVGREGMYLGTIAEQISAPFTESVIIAAVVAIPVGKLLYYPQYMRLCIENRGNITSPFCIICPTELFCGINTITIIEKRIDNTPITTRISINVKPLFFSVLEVIHENRQINHSIVEIALSTKTNYAFCIIEVAYLTHLES